MFHIVQGLMTQALINVLYWRGIDIILRDLFFVLGDIVCVAVVVQEMRISARRCHQSVMQHYPKLLRNVCIGALARHASHVTRHTSHVTRHTSHVTRHTSHVTRHTSHVTRHTSHVTHNRVRRDVGHAVGHHFRGEARGAQHFCRRLVPHARHGAEAQTGHLETQTAN
jgi:hypothetical protein